MGLRVVRGGGGAGQRPRGPRGGEGFLPAARAPDYHGTRQNPPQPALSSSSNPPSWSPQVSTHLRSEFSLHFSPSHEAGLAVLVWARLGCSPQGLAQGKQVPERAGGLWSLWEGQLAGEPWLLCPRYAHVLTPYMNTVPAVIAKASAIHNPIIYAITHPKYRCSPPPGPSPRSPGHGGPEAMNGSRDWPSFLSLLYALGGGL